MKKFVFSLQALYNYKLTVERLQKADLKKAQAALQELLDEESRLLRAYSDNESSLERALKSGQDVGNALMEHDYYFRFLRDALEQIRIEIEKAEEVVRKCQDKLILTMKEIKTYLKLRDEQFEEYKKEIQTEEAKDIDDLVSFNIINDGN